MPVKHFDNVGTFAASGTYDFRSAEVLLPVSTTIPAITQDNGQMFFHTGNQRLYYTAQGVWHYLIASGT
jgi:hypothetical protein